jgi:hypothetical protein
MNKILSKFERVYLGILIFASLGFLFALFGIPFIWLNADGNWHRGVIDIDALQR